MGIRGQQLSGGFLSKVSLACSDQWLWDRGQFCAVSLKREDRMGSWVGFGLRLGLGPNPTQDDVTSGSFPYSRKGPFSK